MTEDTEKTLKIRFRFPGGEEFEAQGTLEFIEQQRNFFLSLIGKKEKRSSTSTLHPQQPTPLKQEVPAMLPPHQPNREQSPVLEAFPAKRLWEKLFKEEGELVILRRKMRLDAPEAALLLLAGARVLLNKSDCKALTLSQMMQKSGFGEAGRLDRLLQQEILSGYVQNEGMKRGRIYRLTNSGFAHAFVLAEKLAGELL